MKIGFCPPGAAETGSTVTFEIRADSAVSAVLRIWDDEEGENRVQMERRGENFFASVRMPSSGRLLWYYFLFAEESGNTEEFHPEEGGDFQLTVYKPFTVPEWYKNGIAYQIFPDRFCKDEAAAGRASSLGITLKKWGTPPVYDKEENGDIRSWDFYGGSLNGIREKLLYLQSLNVTVIYLNPIFRAVSNHRYDTCDYFQIDPLLGTEEDFRELCREAKEAGIHIILDGVFSHVGKDSVYFKDEKCRSWFTFDGSEAGYQCWWGVKDLPEVNEMDPGFTELICGEKGVIRYWLERGADGFRLDVADELPDAFIRLIRKAVKSCGEDKLLIGEVWEDASNKVSYGEKRRFLMGEELDSVMNYPFRSLAIDFAMHRIGSDTFLKEYRKLEDHYPKESFYGAFDLLGSHDRRRILTEVDGIRERVKFLSVLSYTLPGVPVIYYGDERGLRGGADPENRGCMDWSETADPDMEYHYRMLGLLYKEHPVLCGGEFAPVDLSDEDVLAFLRSDASEQILVVINRHFSETKKCFYETDAAEGFDLLHSVPHKVQDGRLRLELAPLSAQVILLEEKKTEKTKLERKLGVICALSSVPGGKLGKGAREFVDFLADAGIGIWQMLPIHPRGLGNSPYLSPCVFKGSDEYLDPEEPEKDFEEQWAELRAYAHEKGIRLVGDIPIYVDPAGEDVKNAPEYFQLDGDGHLKLRAGVPPDYFQKDGQDWGNPLYDWEKMKEDNYRWWIRRIGFCSRLFDTIRLDHFRAFSAYYAIPRGKTAKEGAWLKGPGLDLFREIKKQLPGTGFIAEDLGSLDNGVFDLLYLSGIPGMNVWQFSADEMLAMTPEEQQDRIFYSGTHDNETLKGFCEWMYPGEDADAKCDEIMETLCESHAPWVIFQLQDFLHLGNEARMNVPGTVGDNWTWQAEKEMLTSQLAEKIRALAERTKRK